MKKLLNLSILVGFAIGLLSCQSAPKKTTQIFQITASDESAARQSLATLSEAKSALPLQNVSYLLYDPVTKQILDRSQEHRASVPASTLKVLNTVASLHILGPDYKFKTTLAHDGKLQGQTLHGNIYLKGTGDPSLSAADLMHLSQQLAKRGIQKITGRFFYDETDFTPESAIDATRDDWASYNSGISALSVDFNQQKIQWFPSAQPFNENIYFVPDVSFIRADLLKEETALETKILYQRNESFDQWLLSAAETGSGEGRVPVKRPGYYAATLFREFCRLSGVELPLPMVGALPLKHRIVAVYESAPLVDVVGRILEYSNNMMAELVQMAAARKLSGKSISMIEASAIIHKWIQSRLPHASWDGSQVVNGSGLGSKNRISSAQLVAVLNLADRLTGPNGRSYESLLPISGWKGTLSSRLSVPGGAFRVWAKTGSVNYASNLAGYVHTLGGRRLIFAIMVSDLEKRASLDQLQSALSEAERKTADQWAKEARQLQDTMLAKWILGN